MPRKSKITVPEPRKLPSGNYFIQLRIGGKSISITEPDAATCHAKAVAIKAGLLEQKQKPEAITLRTAIDRYIEARSAALSPSTVRGYRAIQKNRFADIMDQPLSRLTKNSAQRSINAQLQTLAPKTVKNSWAFIASVLKDADIYIEVTLPKIMPNEHPFFSVDEVKIFLDAIKDTDIEIPCLFALQSLRLSEILGLRWQDVDLDKKQIRIRHTRVQGPEHTLVAKDTTKNATSARIVAIPSRLAALLDAQDKNTEYVCNINSRTLLARINRLCRRHNLPEVGVHGLRHSFASLGYHLGVPSKVMQEMGGWSDDHTMLKIYTHISQVDAQKHQSALTSFFDQHANAVDNK